MHKHGKIVKDKPTFLNGSYFLLLPSYLANKVHSLVEESVQREVLHKAYNAHVCIIIIITCKYIRIIRYILSVM